MEARASDEFRKQLSKTVGWKNIKTDLSTRHNGLLQEAAASQISQRWEVLMTETIIANLPYPCVLYTFIPGHCQRCHNDCRDLWPHAIGICLSEGLDNKVRKNLMKAIRQYSTSGLILYQWVSDSQHRKYRSVSFSFHIPKVMHHLKLSLSLFCFPLLL